MTTEYQHRYLYFTEVPGSFEKDPTFWRVDTGPLGGSEILNHPTQTWVRNDHAARSYWDGNLDGDGMDFDARSYEEFVEMLEQAGMNPAMEKPEESSG